MDNDLNRGDARRDQVRDFLQVLGFFRSVFVLAAGTDSERADDFSITLHGHAQGATDAWLAGDMVWFSQSVQKELRSPRAFAVDPSGRWLICAGQTDNVVAVYAIDAGSGMLTRTQRMSMPENPSWIETLSVEGT